METFVKTGVVHRLFATAIQTRRESRSAREFDVRARPGGVLRFGSCARRAWGYFLRCSPAMHRRDPPPMEPTQPSPRSTRRWSHRSTRCRTKPRWTNRASPMAQRWGRPLDPTLRRKVAELSRAGLFGARRPLPSASMPASRSSIRAAPASPGHAAGGSTTSIVPATTAGAALAATATEAFPCPPTGASSATFTDALFPSGRLQHRPRLRATPTQAPMRPPAHRHDPSASTMAKGSRRGYFTTTTARAYPASAPGRCSPDDAPMVARTADASSPWAPRWPPLPSKRPPCAFAFARGSWPRSAGSRAFRRRAGMRRQYCRAR